METAISVNGVPIRLTDERWDHIIENHVELDGYDEDCLRVIREPDLVLAGTHGSLKAVKGFGRKGYLFVVYRELSRNDGFIITAFFSRKLDTGKILWRR